MLKVFLVLGQKNFSKEPNLRQNFDESLILISFDAMPHRIKSAVFSDKFLSFHFLLFLRFVFVETIQSIQRTNC